MTSDKFKIDTIILEDEDGTRKILIKCLEDFSEINIIGEAKSLDAAFQLISTKKPQAAFMDIKLIGGDVFVLLNRLKKANIPIPKIVLITGFPDFAIQSLNEFRSSIVKYIMKPFLEDWESKFRDAIDALMMAIPENNLHMIPKHAVEQNDSTLIKSGKHLYNINFDKIVWVEVAGGGSIYLVLENKELKIDSTLTKFLQSVPDNMLVQISREYAVNRKKIISIDKEDRGVFISYNDKEKFLGIGDRFYSSLIKTLKG